MDTASSSRQITAIERRNRYVAKGVSVQNPIVITRAEGARMWDDAGKEYLDFAGGIGCLNVGSSHPEIVAAVKEQADKFFHTCFHVAMNEPYLDLAQALCHLVPIEGEVKAFLANSGAEAVENAIKVAKAYTGRSAVIAFDSAFHGRTQYALSLTSKVHPYKAGFGPYTSDVYRLPYANPYRNPFGGSPEDCVDACIAAVRHAFDTVLDANEVAAMIIEPVQGEGGFIVPPADYLPRLRALCRAHGILFIVDEVQSGFGRTGEMFAANHYPVLDPDIMTMAKSMGAGLPISAVVGRAEIMDSTEVGGLGGTYGGNPLAAVAALKVIEIMQRDELSQRARYIGRRMMESLESLQAEWPCIGDVRGQGAMVAMELVKGPVTKEPYAEAAAIISKKCLEKGLLTIKAGVYNNVIRLLSPLVITEEELNAGLSLLAQAVFETVEELAH